MTTSNIEAQGAIGPQTTNFDPLDGPSDTKFVDLDKEVINVSKSTDYSALSSEQISALLASDLSSNHVFGMLNHLLKGENLPIPYSALNDLHSDIKQKFINQMPEYIKLLQNSTGNGVHMLNAWSFLFLLTGEHLHRTSHLNLLLNLAEVLT